MQPLDTWVLANPTSVVNTQLCEYYSLVVSYIRPSRHTHLLIGYEPQTDLLNTTTPHTQLLSVLFTHVCCKWKAPTVARGGYNLSAYALAILVHIYNNLINMRCLHILPHI